MTEKYWRSVRFYKHLYTSCLIVIILFPLTAAFYFWQVSEAATKRQANRISDHRTEVGSELPRVFTNPDSYRKKYPDLYASAVRKQAISENTVYLTFDDGPSPVTGQVLDVLKHYRIKGTFFVIGENLKTVTQQEMLRRILKEGHSLGMHSDTHRYRKIYATVDAWLDDFAAVHQRISDITGRQSTIFRFPGGSINIYNAPLYQEIIAEMTRRGYVYFDWNVSVGDISLSPQRAEALFANVVTRSSGDSRVVILMHDSATKTETVKALPKIIEHYRSKGYSFGSLQNSTYPITFGYRS